MVIVGGIVGLVVGLIVLHIWIVDSVAHHENPDASSGSNQTMASPPAGDEGDVTFNEVSNPDDSIPCKICVALLGWWDSLDWWAKILTAPWRVWMAFWCGVVNSCSTH